MSIPWVSTFVGLYRSAHSSLRATITNKLSPNPNLIAQYGHGPAIRVLGRTSSDGDALTLRFRATELRIPRLSAFGSGDATVVGSMLEWFCYC